MGRPSKLTPELQEAICKALRAADTRKNACDMVGLDYSTFARWMVLAKKEGDEYKAYREFAEAVKRAESHALHRNLRIIQKAAKKNWFAAAWTLERKRYEDWGKDAHRVKDLEKEIRELQRTLAKLLGESYAEVSEKPTSEDSEVKGPTT